MAYLGEMDEGGRLGIRQVAEDSPGYQMSLLYGSVPEWVEVDVRRVHTERARRFGDVWLAVELLKRLGLDQYFRDAAFAEPREPTLYSGDAEEPVEEV